MKKILEKIWSITALMADILVKLTALRTCEQLPRQIAHVMGCK